LNRIVFRSRIGWYAVVGILMLVLGSGGICCGAGADGANRPLSTYAQWRMIGTSAAETALRLLDKAAATPCKKNLVALTNAGYAEVALSSTQGALDGLTEVAGVSRGRNTLVEVHASFDSPLWFAFFDKDSGYCAYLQVDPTAAVKVAGGPSPLSGELFDVKTTQRIDAAYLYRHAADPDAPWTGTPFGGNAFRIITIANAVAAGAPADLVRAVEFHDHFCPGVTSGLFMARYLKKHFPPGKGGYFVQAVQPWCKEDALMVLLNATPGKGGYAVRYPTPGENARRLAEAQNASTIVYRENPQGTGWEGVVLGFEWAQTSCAKTDNGMVDKLCADLWYLERLNATEDFIKVIKRFTLPDGVAPKDWARPGVDPMQKLGLMKQE
jgi:formylmethanofuran dehydrogenase subunit E-like metal-binding protein